MNEADRIWDELDNIYSQWGITEIPFSESASTLRESQLRKVFTGRSQELGSSGFCVETRSIPIEYPQNSPKSFAQ